jgi:uncharacterized protein (TIGR03435 family)
MRHAIITAVFCALALAQTFEVASVKPAPPDDGTGMTRVQGGPGTSDPGQITFRNISLMNLLGLAYPEAYRTYGPGWLDQDKFDVVAKLPPGTTKEQFAVMMRNLLAERFGVKAHQETREFAAYDLVVAKTGLKLKESVDEPNAAPTPAGQVNVADDGFPKLTRPGMQTIFKNGVGARMTAKAQPMSNLARALEAQLEKPVVDKTGLTGKYDFKLEYSPGVSANTPDPEVGAAGIAYAIKSLGLTLQDTKRTLDVVVIDHAERVPTEN